MSSPPPQAISPCPPPLLQVRGLRKSYGSTEILHGIDFELGAGERLALMGPSGSGKSTLLNCLGGIDRPDGGEIWLAGTCLNHLKASELAAFRRDKISTVFQFFHLLPTLTVRENIEFPLHLLGVAFAERENRTSELIQEVGLSRRQAAFPDSLSGGEMQRVAIARALVHRPRLILADEPTGNLDTRTGADILALLARLTDQHGTALIMVTHSETAARIGHRTLHMRDGRLTREG